jgi:uridine kinase
MTPFLVAIVGGSGSGKTWLARQLKASLRRRAILLSLDDFYKDCSHLSPIRRARLNFDHPRAIDWPCFERILQKLAAGQPVQAPLYDFRTHSRVRSTRNVKPAGLVLVDGLWLLRRPSVRHLFALKIFIQCPRAKRLRRRLARDLQDRSRSRASVLWQFKTTVEPMHRKYVQPQSRYADLILRSPWTRSQALKLTTAITKKGLRSTL